MKNLNLYIKESILDDEDDLVNDPYIQIYAWVKKLESNSQIQQAKVNKDGSIDANAIDISEPLPDYIKLNKVDYLFVHDCSIKNCEGFPKQSEKILIKNCAELKSLEGFPKGAECDRFVINNSEDIDGKLTSLKSMPKSTNVYFQNVNLKDLSGISDVKVLSIHNCKRLEVINPKSSLKTLIIEHCTKLKDITKLPKNMNWIMANYCNLPARDWKEHLKKNGAFDFNEQIVI